MRKHHLSLFLILILALFGCQKEFLRVDSDTPSSIEKVIYRSNVERIFSEFSFNTAGLLTTEKLKILEGADSSEESISIVRDGNGNVIRTVVSEGISQDLVTNYQYDGSKVRYGTMVYNLGGSSVVDSVVFSIANKVSKTNHYFSLPGLGSIMDSYFEYTYDTRGNLTQVKNYVAGTPPDLSLFSTVTFEYDRMINPWYSNDDALIEFSGRLYTSPNNVRKITEVCADPVYNTSAVYAYQYGTDNRPLKGTRTEDGTTYQVEYIL
jgi:hypothetical protein